MTPNAPELTQLDFYTRTKFAVSVIAAVATICAPGLANAQADTTELIEEITRVCKPDGQVVIINHFSSPRPAIRKVVNLVDPLTRKLGWSTRLSLDDCINGAPLSLENRYKTSPWSLFTVVEARK